MQVTSPAESEAPFDMASLQQSKPKENLFGELHNIWAHTDWDLFGGDQSFEAKLGHMVQECELRELRNPTEETQRFLYSKLFLAHFKQSWAAVSVAERRAQILQTTMRGGGSQQSSCGV